MCPEMTGNTCDIPVFRLIVSHYTIHFRVAGSTIFRYNILIIFNNQRLMGHMTPSATVISHCVGMREMTVPAGLNLPVIVMTCRTGKYRMGALMCLQLVILFRMAAQTGLGYIMSKLYLQRAMRIDMTCAAIAKGKMLLLIFLVTAAAGRNDFHIRRRVASMTIQADILMRHPFPGQNYNNLLMAFLAVTGPNRGIYRPEIRLWHTICYDIKQQNGTGQNNPLGYFCIKIEQNFKL